MPYRTFHPVGVSPAIVVTTGSEVPGQRVVAILGVARGIAVRQPARPGEEPVARAVALRKAAEERLIAEATSLQAEAVICMRYDSNDTEVVAYGTAVRVSA